MHMHETRAGEPCAECLTREEVLADIQRAHVAATDELDRWHRAFGANTTPEEAKADRLALAEALEGLTRTLSKDFGRGRGRTPEEVDAAWRAAYAALHPSCECGEPPRAWRDDEDGKLRAYCSNCLGLLVNILRGDVEDL